MTNPHRGRNRGSPEHRKSIQDIHLQIEKQNRLNRIGSMQQKLAVRFKSSFGPDLDAIDAFKKGEDYQGFTGKGKNKRLKFEVTDGGKTLKLLGHTIAQKTPKGLQVSNAGFDTGLTYSSLKELGVNAKRLPNGQVKLHNKTVNGTSGQKVTVPFNEVSDTPVRALKPQAQNKDTRRTVSEQGRFRENVEARAKKEQGITKPGELPLSTSSVQPKDQRQINKITGIKSPLGKPVRATDAHHILPVKNFPGLRNNPNTGVMLTRREHREVEGLNKNLFGSLKQKIAELRAFTNSSSFVGNMRYDRDEQSMTGILKGKHYKWCDIPESKFDSFKGAGSAGAYFNRSIKGQHDCGSGGILSDLKSKISALKIARFNTQKDIDDGMQQVAKNLSADSIVNGFIQGKHDIKGISGVYDPIENKILDATRPEDAMRLQKFYESGKNSLGFNSITDTRAGPATDIELIRAQLKDVEQSGGVPALGFDEGSLEALDVAVGSDEDIFSKLLDHQNSTAILDSDTSFRILDNPKFQKE